MNIDALVWYAQDRFTAADVTRATGLTERAQRELLKAGVIQAVPQAKTKARLLDARMLKRSAIIAPLNNCGLSLAVSGQIVFAAPFVDDFLFDIIDPLQAFLNFGQAVDPDTNLPPKRSDPDPLGCFDPTKLPMAEPKHDWLLEVVNGRYVAVCSREGADLFGELSDDKTAFFWWKVALVTQVRDPGTADEVHLGPKFNWDRSMSDDLLNFQIKEITEADEEAAKFALANPTTKISLNVNLALKIALRRLLYIDAPQEH